MNEPMSAKERGAQGAAKRWGKDGEEIKEVPKYRLTGICYHNDRIYDPELQPLIDKDDPNSELRPLYLEFSGRPEWYMEPANDAARAMCEQFPPKQWCDPIVAATAITSAPATIGAV